MARRIFFLQFFSILWLSSTALQAAETSVDFAMDEASIAADYSSATLISARALDEAGEPLTNVRLYFSVARLLEDADGGLSYEQDPVEIGNARTDATGTATMRLILVNGVYDGLNFEASNPTATQKGEPYEIIVEFQGDVDNETVFTDAGPEVISTVYAPSSNTFPLYVTTEMTRIEIAAGNTVALGDRLQLIATLTDPNGDASESGQETDGPGPKD